MREILCAHVEKKCILCCLIVDELYREISIRDALHHKLELSHIHPLEHETACVSYLRSFSVVVVRYFGRDLSAVPVEQR